ncbi:hypothetical protein NJ76_32020 [Rhodococcus sp. IITR03]|nr:hypothetical protein NJ76_32020 [Rhodococcus sp. IITR03]
MDARTDLRDLKATVEALDRGETTSTDLVRASLGRIDESQPHLNAFRVVRRTAALDEAREADRRRANGERLPLLGVPIAIKDDTDIVGETTMFGCAGTFTPEGHRREVVRRLRPPAR